MEVSGLLDIPNALSRGKQQAVLICTLGWVGPSTDLEVLEKKRIFPAGNRTRIALSFNP